METILSSAIGVCICLFGIWCFLKGQESMAEIVRDGKPQNLKGPLAILKENVSSKFTREEDADLDAVAGAGVHEFGGIAGERAGFDDVDRRPVLGQQGLADIH